MVNSTIPDKGIEWKSIQENGYKIYQSGSHIKGNFIRLFVPDVPYRDKNGKVKLIVYLHGFALCMPRFYEEHLKRLVEDKHYYVFFPDFQNSNYPNDIEDERNQKAPAEKNHFGFWLSVVRDLIFKGENFSIEDLYSEEEKQSQQIPGIEGKLTKPSFFEYLRVALALLVLIAVINLIYWFNRTYGKHLIHLISTVGLSLLHKPTQWIEHAIDLTKGGWQKLVEENHELAQKEMDVYVFGHSLGGLLALSWPAYICSEQDKFFPKQVITADPAPSTEMGIPSIAIWILKLFHSPFTSGAINIRKIGNNKLLKHVPIGIMHGADDKIVKPQSWIKPPFLQKESNFDCIKSEHKKIYFSLSNKQNHPPLTAFHNQAVTNTEYFDDALFKNFGGVKHNANAYNKQYIYPGLDLVVKEEVTANNLLGKFPLENIKVTETLPDKPPNFKLLIAIVLAVLALLGLGYWFLHSGAV